MSAAGATTPKTSLFGTELFSYFLALGRVRDGGNSKKSTFVHALAHFYKRTIAPDVESKNIVKF